MRIFISGVIQGSREDRDVQQQDYRQLIAKALRSRHPHVEVVDPWEIFPDAVDYPLARAKETLLQEIEMAAKCDALIAYVPQATMGSSLEMWAAYQAGVPVLTVSKMVHNWVVQSLSTAVYPELEDLLEFIQAGGIDDLLDGRKGEG